jgi:hypothetical protein
MEEDDWKEGDCLGLPDWSSPKNPKPILRCSRPVEEGEEWCKECGETIMVGLSDSMAKFAHMEAPHVPISLQRRIADRLFGVVRRFTKKDN